MTINRITPEAHKQYFATLATYNRKIAYNVNSNKQFVCVDMEEVDESVFSKLDLRKWCMVLEDIDGGIIGPSDEQLLISVNSAFLIFKYVEPGDRDAEREVLDEAYDIGLQFIAKMTKDGYDWIPGVNDNIMVNFSPTSVRFQKLKAINDNCFGYRFEFSYSKFDLVAYDQGDWI